MSEAYQQKEWELDSLIDNLNSIEYTYEEYKKEVEYFIDGLLKDTKEINTLRNENKRLNNIINEFDKWLLGEQMMFYRGSDNETLIRFNETVNKWLELKGSDKK